MQFEFFLPTYIFFGKSSLNRIQDIVRRFSSRRILIVTGKSSSYKSGNLDKLLNLLKAFSCFVFNNISPNPDAEIIDRGVQYTIQRRIELIIGLGGGSALDAAKSIALMTTQKFSTQAAFQKKGKYFKKGLPYIAIPTTAGSGGEVTKWASIWDHEVKKKQSLDHPFMYPSYSIIDPTLMLNTPKRITAVTALDALCHAIEAFWSKKANPISDEFAQQAACLIVKNLPLAIKYPGTFKYRDALSRASLFAGLAFSQTKSTACHAISYPLTAYYKVPHGLACAISLPHLYEFNRAAIQDKAVKIAEWFKCNSVEMGSSSIANFIKNLNLPLYLSEMNVKIDSIQKVFQYSLRSDQIKNNPRKISKENLYKIVKRIQ